MTEILDEKIPEEEAPKKLEPWQKYKRRLFLKMASKRLLFLGLLVSLYILADYKWGEGLLMGETIWGFFFYIPVSMLYASLAFTIDFSEDYRKDAAFAFIFPFIVGIIMFMYILWIQIDIQGSIDPRAATAIIPWRWNALIYVLISEACNAILFAVSFREEKMKQILKRQPKELLKYLGDK